jgi:hypothetical protein
MSKLLSVDKGRSISDTASRVGPERGTQLVYPGMPSMRSTDQGRADEAGTGGSAWSSSGDRGGMGKGRATTLEGVSGSIG